MRNSRRLVSGLVLALVMSTALSAETGGPSRDSCTFLQGILYKVGNIAVVQTVFSRVFVECTFQ